MEQVVPKILLVDDNEDMLTTLNHLFTLYEYDVVLAKNGKEAIEVAERELPNLIILDALMPVMNGFEACRRLKSSILTQHIPVIFLSANYTEEKHRIEGLELGADDYILKPFNAKELMARVKTILDRKQIIDELRTNISQLLDMHNSVNEELAELKEKAEMLESGQFTDKLTGLYNRSFFKRRLEEEFHRARRYGNPLSLVLMEVDNFDKHLDTHGKEAGDYILMQTAKIILNNTRLSDIVFRLDTCKFAIILNDTPEKGAIYETERIKKVIEDTRLFTHDFFEQNKTVSKQQKGNHNITVSIGLISLMESIKEPNDLFTAAEELLEKAKTADRNIAVGYQRFGQV